MENNVDFTWMNNSTILDPFLATFISFKNSRSKYNLHTAPAIPKIYIFCSFTIVKCKMLMTTLDCKHCRNKNRIPN